MRTVPCRPRKIVSCLFWSTSSSIPFICSMDACSACASPKRPIPRPTDATEQQTCYSGKKKRHMLKNLLLINATLRIVFLSEAAPGSIHDKRMADMTPYPLPAGSQLLQDVGFQGFTLEGVAILQPTKKPR